MKNYIPITYPLLADMPITTDANIKACEYRIKGLYNASLPLTGKIPCNAVRFANRSSRTWEFACYGEDGVPFCIYSMYANTAYFMKQGLSYKLNPQAFRLIQEFNISKTEPKPTK